MKGSSLKNSLIRKKLLDEFYQRAVDGETLKDTADWLATHDIHISLTAIHRARGSGIFAWKMKQLGRSDLAIDVTTDERDEDTLDLISKGIHSAATEMATPQELRQVVQLFRDYMNAKGLLRNEGRAEMEQMRKWGSKLIDLLESPEEADRLRKINEDTKHKGLEHRMSALVEAVWGNLSKAA
jgi:hypothetical protein